MTLRTRNPGALAGATGAKIKAGELPGNDSTAPSTVPAFPRQAAWRSRNPLATWAHGALRSGLRRGVIVRQPCEECGSPEAEAHHEDYGRPLAVRWLCRAHHKAAHARGRAKG